MITTTLAAPMRSTNHLPYMPQYWRAVMFLITSVLLGAIWFSLLTMLLSLGGQLLIVGIGLPILFFDLVVVKFASRIERARLALLLDLHIVATYREIPSGSWWQRSLAFVNDPAIWRDVTYILLLIPLGMLDVIVFSIAFVVPVGIILFPILSLWLHPIPLFSILESAFWIIVPVTLLLGVIGLWAGSYLITGMVHLHAICAGQLLGTPIAERMAALTKSRNEVLNAALAERQRIAQDIHDGAQQRLIALAIDLGLAKEKLDTEPDTVRSLILKSHEHAKRLLVELRDLVRGIYPAILTERGLDAALSALASRSPIPVTVTVQFQRRFPILIESTSYFFVAEALTNVAKHSGAASAAVTLTYDGMRLIIDVIDDGHGGATITLGSGLAGLYSRLTALDGTMTLRSPQGGPTHLQGVIPCAS